MRISIANLRAAGLSDSQIVRIFEDADAERREKARIIKRNQRARPPDSVDTQDIRGSFFKEDKIGEEKKEELSKEASKLTSTVSSTSLEKNAASEKIPSDWPGDYCAQFWARYPRKVGKKAAFRKLELVRRMGEVAWAPFLAAVALVGKGVEDPKFIPHPTTWLHQGRYLDGIAAGPPPDAKPAWATPPDWYVKREKEREEANAKAKGTGVRSDAGLGKNGAG